MPLSKEAMIHEIINNCKANDVYVSGDMFFSLAFKSESELHTICNELNIKNS